MTGIEPLPTTGSSSLQLGISMDQILANAIGQDTPLPSLELGLEGADTVNGVGTCDVGFSCAYQNRLAWSGPSTPLPVETNPRVVFDRLFGGIDSTDPTIRKARLHRQGSILDSVLDKVERLEGELGARDRAKIGEYLESVREIQQAGNRLAAEDRVGIGQHSGNQPVDDRGIDPLNDFEGQSTCLGIILAIRDEGLEFLAREFLLGGDRPVDDRLGRRSQVVGRQRVGVPESGQ